MTCVPRYLRHRLRNMDFVCGDLNLVNVAQPTHRFVILRAIIQCLCRASIFLLKVQCISGTNYDD